MDRHIGAMASPNQQPLAAGQAVLDVIANQDFLANVTEFVARLSEAARQYEAPQAP